MKILSVSGTPLADRIFRQPVSSDTASTADVNEVSVFATMARCAAWSTPIPTGFVKGSKVFGTLALDRTWRAPLVKSTATTEGGVCSVTSSRLRGASSAISIGCDNGNVAFGVVALLNTVRAPL